MRARHAVSAAWLAVALLTGLGSAGVAAQMRDVPNVPPSVEDGDWYGSWVYVSSHARIALFVREAEVPGASPEIRLRFQSLRRLEEFETGWDGKAEYLVSGRPARFDLAITERGPDRMTGTWSWAFPVGEFVDRQDGSFEMYRTGDGRRLAMTFPEGVRLRRTRDGETEQERTDPRVWTFVKASRRLVLWEELPF